MTAWAIDSNEDQSKQTSFNVLARPYQYIEILLRAMKNESANLTEHLNYWKLRKRFGVVSVEETERFRDRLNSSLPKTEGTINVTDINLVDILTPIKALKIEEVNKALKENASDDVLKKILANPLLDQGNHLDNANFTTSYLDNLREQSKEKTLLHTDLNIAGRNSQVERLVEAVNQNDQDAIKQVFSELGADAATQTTKYNDITNQNPNKDFTVVKADKFLEDVEQDLLNRAIVAGNGNEVWNILANKGLVESRINPSKENMNQVFKQDLVTDLIQQKDAKGDITFPPGYLLQVCVFYCSSSLFHIC